MRTGFLADELVRRGHEVTWWASSFDHYAKDWVRGDAVRTLPNGVTLRLISGIGYRKNVSIRRFIDHALVARKFAREIEHADPPDVIIAALPDYRISYRAYHYAKRRGIPFIVDLRDRWPWDFLPLLPSVLRVPARLALFHDFILARRVLRGADGLATMLDAWIEWTYKRVDRPRGKDDRVFYLGAGEPKSGDSSKLRPSVRDALAISQNRWVVLFVGAFTNKSSPETLVEAAHILRRRHPDLNGDIHFILAGDGDHGARVRAMAADCPEITLPGFVNDLEIGALLAHAQVGVVTGNDGFWGMPNKVFTYLSGGLPIVSEVRGELIRLIDEEKLGLNYSGAEALADALTTLYRDRGLAEEMGRNARKLFEDRFSSARIYGDYASYVERVAEAHPK